MQKTPPAVPASLSYSKMLFLVSHGLQTPLSAIRWGCGRLRRTAKNLTEEQSQLLQNVQHEARTLSEMFDRLLLLGKVEERVHVPDIQEIFVRDFLTADERAANLPREIRFDVACAPDLAVRADRTIFRSIIDGLLLVIAVGSKEKAVPVTVQKEADAGMCAITMTAPLELSLLHELSETPDESQPRIVGGVPGFLLAVSSALAHAAGGSLSAQDDQGSVRRLILRVPLTPPLALGA